MRKLIPLSIAILAGFALPLSSHAKPVIKLAAPKSQPVTAPGPKGDLAGTLLDAGSKSPLVFILPGSGPTDRDGNNPQGVNAASYRMLVRRWRQRAYPHYALTNVAYLAVLRQ